jgi:signal transduction histidine kinase
MNDEQLAAILEVARLLATRHELQELTPRFLSCLIRTLEAADSGILLLYEPEHNWLTVSDAQGYDLDTLRQIHIAPGEGMSGRAFQHERSANYATPKDIEQVRANLTPKNRALFRAATAALKSPQSAVAVPMVAAQGKVGVLVLENRSSTQHFGAALPFLEAVAQLIALSIENARLRQELSIVHAREQANHFKAELISTLAHEMRTPLTSIKGFSTALLMEEATFSPHDQQEFLKIIDQECDVLTQLIHDLLESSIIDAGMLTLELQPVILSRLARAIVDDLRRQTSIHRFVVDLDALPIVDADPGRIEQVLRNLLDNAVKYSPRGGMIVLRGEVQPGYVVISVSDQGVGIAPEHLNRLFEKFFRIESETDQHVVGSGLGLPIARTIVNGHGGQIWAESKLGQGSTFFFTLPLREDRIDG